MSHETRFVSGDALAVVDAGLTIRAWNAGAESLTGIPAREAVGRACWEVVRAVDEAGGAVCDPLCPRARSALAGRPVGRQTVSVRTRAGRRAVSLSTVAVADRDGPRLLHLFHPPAAHEARPAAVGNGALPALTKRQRQVLQLLADGVAAKEVAARLEIRETTARNHIRAILFGLGAHSQLEAVARAARLGLIQR